MEMTQYRQQDGCPQKFATVVPNLKTYGYSLVWCVTCVAHRPTSLLRATPGVTWSEGREMTHADLPARLDDPTGLLRTVLIGTRLMRTRKGHAGSQDDLHYVRQGSSSVSYGAAQEDRNPHIWGACSTHEQWQGPRRNRGRNANIVLTRQELFLTTALSFAARRFVPSYLRHGRSVVFRRWDLFRSVLCPEKSYGRGVHGDVAKRHVEIEVFTIPHP
jgi:hypothetical protein